ncbi:MAG: hypothetical protein J0L92_03950 [Deltaproteobacteria bacterium]|nr:hypothetical protein [Deltaproteobacteria bacterium]
MNPLLLQRIGASRPRARDALLIAAALLWAGCPSPATPEDATTTSLDAAREDDAFETPVDDSGPRPDGGARVDAASADDASIDALALGDASADAHASTDASACTSISEEVCNGIDDTCDGVVDEGCAASTSRSRARARARS